MHECFAFRIGKLATNARMVLIFKQGS